MNRTYCNILSIVVALVVAGGALFAADSKPPAQPSYNERYGILGEGNIFLKDRSKRQPTSRPPRDFNSERARPVPESSFVLRGVVEEEGQNRAYVEDLPNAKMIRLGVNDPLGRGHVRSIEIDAVAFENLGIDHIGGRANRPALR